MKSKNLFYVILTVLSLSFTAGNELNAMKTSFWEFWKNLRAHRGNVQIYSDTNTNRARYISGENFLRYVTGLNQSEFEAKIYERDGDIEGTTYSGRVKPCVLDYYSKWDERGWSWRNEDNNFQMLSIAELQQAQNDCVDEKGHFGVIQSSQFDLAEMQADASNNDAVFHVWTDDRCRLSSKNLLSNERFLRVCLPVMPSALWRIYIAPVSSLLENLYKIDREARIPVALNSSCLTNVPANSFFSAPAMESSVGYSSSSAGNSPVKDKFFYDAQVLNVVKIGCQFDMQVIGRPCAVSGKNYFELIERGQCINQFFTTAFNSTKPRAKALIYAAYEGVLRASAAYGKKKVFLTLPSAELNSDVQWIVDAIIRMEPFIQDSGLDVALLWDSRDQIPEELVALAAFIKV